MAEKISSNGNYMYKFLPEKKKLLILQLTDNISYLSKNHI